MKELEKGGQKKEVLDSIRKSLQKGDRNTEIQKTTNNLDIESISIPFNCSTTGKKSVLVLRRNPFSHKYVVTEIAKERQKPTMNNWSVSDIKSLNIKTTDIDWNSVKCPFCVGIGGTQQSNVVRCSCGKLSCAGGQTKQDYFTCPWCGDGGFVKGEFEEVTANPDYKTGENKPQKMSYLPTLKSNNHLTTYNDKK